jgi:hypothetical protein
VTLLFLLSVLSSRANWTDVSVHDLLRAYAFGGVPLGLLLGMALGLLARWRGPAAPACTPWTDYGSFERRAARLAHIAAVLLPALAGLYALLLAGPAADSGAAHWGARLWIAGGTSLPLALLGAAYRPRRAFIVVLPAVLLVAASLFLAAAGLSGGAS